MFKKIFVLVMGMLMAFSVMAACPEKCNNSCGTGDCYKEACGCDIEKTKSESASNTGECTRYSDGARQSDADVDGGSTAVEADVQKN